MLEVKAEAKSSRPKLRPKFWLRGPPEALTSLQICLLAYKIRHDATQLNSPQRASMDSGVKHLECPHLSSHFCISSTLINLIRVLICRRFRSVRPQSYITSWYTQNLSKRALNRQTVSTSTIITCAQKLTSWICCSLQGTNKQLECGLMPNVMAALPNIGCALCSTPQTLSDAHY